jgi:hypothetical protein
MRKGDAGKLRRGDAETKARLLTKEGWPRFADGVVLALLFTLILASACGPNQKILQSANEKTESNVPSANVEPSKSSFEQDVEAMRNADFKFILVFRRKDGAALTENDKKFANTTTFAANRRRLADEGKAVIIGSNSPFVLGMQEKMAERFTMENYSKPDSGPLESNSIPNSKRLIEN